MSRLTGKDALGMFEAYQAVYAPQEEISEEQIWEEVESWVNSLVEEGNDLSEYTWEEMYEAYLSEGGPGPRAGTTPSAPSRPYMGSLSAGGGRAAIDKLTAKGVNPRKAHAMVVGQGDKNLRARSSATPAPKPSAPAPGDYKSRFAGARDAAVAKAQNIKGSPVVGPRPAAAPASRPAAAPASRPAAAPASRPAAAPASRPAAAPAAPTAAAKPSPTAAAKPSAMDAWAKANPKLAQAQKIRQQGGSRAEVNKSLYNKGTAASEKTPTVVKSSFDMFDVVKAHLLDEGYADTEDAALAIMANMSEEWRQSILEADERPENINSPAHTVAARNDTRSDRQKRMAEFGSARLRAASASSMVKGS